MMVKTEIKVEMERKRRASEIASDFIQIIDELEEKVKTLQGKLKEREEEVLRLRFIYERCALELRNHLVKCVCNGSKEDGTEEEMKPGESEHKDDDGNYPDGLTAGL
jgi:hypothetical protein